MINPKMEGFGIIVKPDPICSFAWHPEPQPSRLPNHAAEKPNWPNQVKDL